MLKLKDWAIREGVKPLTAYRWFHAGILPVKATRVGPRLIIVEEDAPKKESACEVVIYARVSSTDQKDDLSGQYLRVSSWLVEQGITNARVVTEIGSGMNGNRPRLRKILSDPNIKTIVVERRDRFGRMNVELVESVLTATGRSLLVVDSSEVGDDFVRDVTEVLTSLCARLYGKRGTANRARRALDNIKEDR